MWAAVVGSFCAFSFPSNAPLDRRAALAGGASLAAAFVGARPARADGAAAPTFSLKGIPGLTSSSDFSSDRSSVTNDLGVIGRGTNKDKSGRLNTCTENGGKKGCISTFDEPSAESYIPPWTYQPGYSTQAISANDARRQALRDQAGIEANGGEAPPPKPTKSKAEAFDELKAAILANEGKVVEEGDRYIRAEFVADGGLLGGEAIDDVEFLISLDAPIVGYRSAARKGGDDKRQRGRIKDLRKSLKESGWKSVGRQLEGV